MLVCTQDETPPGSSTGRGLGASRGQRDPMGRPALDVQSALAALWPDTAVPAEVRGTQQRTFVREDLETSRNTAETQC